MADPIKLEEHWRKRHEKLTEALSYALFKNTPDGALIEALADSLLSLESTMIAYMPRMVEVEKSL